jgi:hypothetical protein
MKLQLPGVEDFEILQANHSTKIKILYAEHAALLHMN